MKFKFILVVILTFFVLPFDANAEIKLLLKDLKKGDTSADVKVLQQILNQDPATKVASFGAGSPGYETTYFGTLTEAAVKKFQEKYKAEIFSISGLLPVTGKLDIKTRTKMNTIALSGFVSEQGIVASPVAEEEKIENKNFLSITSISSENPVPGETLHIYGSGFSRNSYVYLGLDKKVSFDYVNSGHIKLKISSSAKPAVNLFYVSNYLGDTRWTQPLFVITTDKKIASSSNSDLKSVFEKIQKENKRYTSKVAIAESKERFSFARMGKFIKDIFSPREAYAFTNFDFFGGSISQTYYCTCFYNFGIILDIDDLVSNGTYTTVFNPVYSTLHSNYNLFTSGPNVIAGTTPTFFECEDTYWVPPAEPICAPSTSGGTTADNMIDEIRGAGTSIMGGPA